MRHFGAGFPLSLAFRGRSHCHSNSGKPLLSRKTDLSCPFARPGVRWRSFLCFQAPADNAAQFVDPDAGTLRTLDLPVNFLGTTRKLQTPTVTSGPKRWFFLFLSFCLDFFQSAAPSAPGITGRLSLPARNSRFTSVARLRLGERPTRKALYGRHFSMASKTCNSRTARK